MIFEFFRVYLADTARIDEFIARSWSDELESQPFVNNCDMSQLFRIFAITQSIFWGARASRDWGKFDHIFRRRGRMTRRRWSFAGLVEIAGSLEPGTSDLSRWSDTGMWYLEGSTSQEVSRRRVMGLPGIMTAKWNCKCAHHEFWIYILKVPRADRQTIRAVPPNHGITTCEAVGNRLSYSLMSGDNIRISDLIGNTLRCFSCPAILPPGHICKPDGFQGGLLYLNDFRSSPSYPA